MLKNVKIGFKITALTIVVIISLSLSFIGVFRIIQKTLLELNSQGTYEVLNQTTNNLEIILKNIDDVAMQISRDPEIGQKVVDIANVKDESDIYRLQYETGLMHLM
ncbi:MAG: hypothetical protein BWY74_04359 [Firmicutes bacterium ADurb.Bin419]|nr:MAG: hypothetical protein BWY74_04359 [Firmicutes bacterium ADurb.Bin419]